MYRIRATYLLLDGTTRTETVCISGRMLNKSNWRTRLYKSAKAYADRNGIVYKDVTFDVSPLITSGLLF